MFILIYLLLQYGTFLFERCLCIIIILLTDHRKISHELVSVHNFILGLHFGTDVNHAKIPVHEQSCFQNLKNTFCPTIKKKLFIYEKEKLHRP